jgi:YVTN family beta-propeller protein
MLKLKYAFNPSPNPIVVSVPGLPDSVVGLSVVITNPSASRVELSKIQLVIPVGDESGRCLSASRDLPHPVADSLAGWNVSASGSTVTLLPAGEVGTITDMLAFTLPGITVNETPGTVSITVSETPPSGSKQVDGSTYSLEKVRAEDVPVTNFWAEPAVITEPDQAAVLYWTCSGQGDGYVYSLSSDAGWQPVNCLGAGNCYTCADGSSGITTPLVQRTTTFTLQIIQATQGHRSIVATLQTTVAVTVPYFSSDAYVDNSEAGSGTLARLYWLAFNAAHCQVLMDGRTVDAAAPTDTLDGGYAVIVPADGQPHQFTVVAWPSQGHARATQTFPALHAGSAPAVGTGSQGTAGAVAVTPDNRLALVCSSATDVVTVFDVQTGAPEPGQIATGSGPRGIAVTPDSAQAVVALSAANAVQVIEVAARKAVEPPIPVGADPMAVAVTPDGRLALAACSDVNQVFVVDVSARQVQGPPIAVAEMPTSIAVTPDGALALVACYGADVVTVIDLATRAAEPTPIPAGRQPGSIAVTPDGALALVANFSGNTLTVIDVPARTMEPAQIPLGLHPSGVAVVRGGRYALVSTIEGTVAVIDVPRRAVLSPTVPAGSGGGSIAVSPDGLLGFSTNWDPATVSLV